MKRILSLILISCMLLSFASCSSGKNENEETQGSGTETDAQGENNGTADFEYTPDGYDYMSADLDSMVKLGAYTGIQVIKEAGELTEEEFQSELDALLDSYSYTEQITDRAVAEGDTVNVDYSGYRDGVQFEGGTSQGSSVTVSSGSGYSPGFAEAFEGKNPGEEFSFNVTFPEDYGNAELQGVEVEFKAKVNYICGEIITPELNDEFVSENFGFSNVEEFKISYRGTVQKRKDYYVENTAYTTLWEQIVSNAEVLSYPEEEVERIYKGNREYYEQSAEYYGVDYDTFIKHYMNMTDEDMKNESRSYVKEDLVMYKLIKDLNITISEDEYNEGLEFFAGYYGMTSDELISYYGKDTIYTTIIWEKLMETVAKDNIIKEAEE